MIQFPAVKTICPTLISSPGAGKGTLIKGIAGMLGSKKVLETTTPSRDVWGNFNGLMADSFFVNLNELSKKEMTECEGQFKALVTDQSMTINNKGVNSYKINSFHRFIITTNNAEPIKTEKGDRRNLIIQSSDEKVGNKAYFKELHELLGNQDYLKTCYEHFKSIPDMDKFAELHLPVTEYHTELKQLSMSPIELFVRDYVETAVKDEFVITSKELYEEFKGFVDDNGIKYEVNANQFSVRFSREFKPEVIGTKHTKKGNAKEFNIPALKKHFGMGCLL